MSQDASILTEQIQVLSDILGENVSGDLLDAFLIICSRLVDNFGHHRTEELTATF